MKQKFGAGVRAGSSRMFCFWMNRRPGRDPVSRREFWDTLAHLAGQGLTVLIATPYLDEAERCHRIALVHLGEILQDGTPDEFRESLHAKRIELRSPDLREALPAVRRAIARRATSLTCSDLETASIAARIRPKMRRKRSKNPCARRGIPIDGVEWMNPRWKRCRHAPVAQSGDAGHALSRAPRPPGQARANRNRRGTPHQAIRHLHCCA